MTEAPARDQPVLVCDKISRWFEGVQALKGVSVSIRQR